MTMTLKMIKSSTFVLTAVSIFCVASESLPEAVCGISHTVAEQSSLSIHSKREETGEWVTTISSLQNSEASPNSTDLEVNRSVIACGGKQIVHMKAIIRGTPEYTSIDSRGTGLLFQEKGAKNAVILNDRRTVYRKNEESEEGFGAVLTNRQLRNNELFEVRIDRKISKWKWGMGIGITPLLPADVVYQQWMKADATMFYNNEIYINGVSKIKNYGRDIKQLQVGERLGVMKKDNGDIHFFVNGEDQGKAVTNIPYSVYGVFDLNSNVVQGTIV